ncbi:energy transducer TonB [Photobacterium angustum]|uniref:energy transducer TonB n=1 Tax=Photobacterium angustum TaxID=661 RepID=UPI0005DEFDFD|nr:energy transducer TonB [Photobacterium angustum]KJG15953.1 energy transducer TonB [Photobacterium angustum]KJG21742.1 energy transducer TonB [Photobacterium angustum]KJG30987.1 energy transducer TonB [Photobacterium angustum]PSW95533.1 energy transducer TonB [Photobacterium angustum]PSX01216.1 energy transducer TonB [Photobacterium angustum]
MNIKRYLIAGCASILFHSLIVSAMPEKKIITVPLEKSTSVAVNLVSLPNIKPEPIVEPAKAQPPAIVTPQPVAKTTPTPKTTMKKLVKKSQPEKKTVKAPVQPKKKAPKETVKKPVTKHIQKKVEKKTVPKNVVKTERKTEKFELKPTDSSKPMSSQLALNKPAKAKKTTVGANSPQLVSKPTFATKPSAVKYPRLAKRRGIEGTVLVEVLIAKDGHQVKQKLIKSSGANVLDNAALKAIKKWRFSPHIVDGIAIAHRVQIPVRFKLD